MTVGILWRHELSLMGVKPLCFRFPMREMYPRADPRPTEKSLCKKEIY